MVQLKAPPGVGGEISIAGFPVPIVNGIAEVPPHHVETLRSHGFVLVEGEDALVRGSRAAMVARFINDARAFADTMTDAQLSAYADMATTKPAETTQGAWRDFADRIPLFGKTNGASEAKELGISMPVSSTTKDLRERARAT